jgi:hypothetical protein
MIQFLVSLDFMLKGMITHWQVHLKQQNSDKFKNTSLLRNMDVKFPILLGDKFHTSAYFITSKVGS